MEKSIQFLICTGIVFGLGLLFAFINGFRNSSLIVATVVSTRALSPTAAFLLCALFEVLGAVALGSAVVATMSKRMFGTVFMGPRLEVLIILGAALLASFLWGVLSWWKAMPTSNSHALFAGLAGASWAAAGVQHLKNSHLLTVFIVLILSPVVAFGLAYIVTLTIRYIGEWMTPRVLSCAEGLHAVGSLSVAAADGSNDGQMVMAVLMVASGLIQPGGGSDIHVPLYIRLSVAAAIAAGVLVGGKRILKKMGMSFYRIQVIQGLGAQLTSASMILLSNLNGFPASTTHMISGSIVGAGVARSARSVKWMVAQDIVLSWFLTIPCVGLLAALLYRVGHWILGAL